MDKVCTLHDASFLFSPLKSTEVGWDQILILGSVSCAALSK